MAERTKYQQNIIRNYYQNQESISLQRVQELVTDLYLSEGKKRTKCWESLVSHLQKLGVKEATIKNLLERDDPQLVAQLVQKLAS
ncbi:MAG: hypothetical protein KF851_09130 [Pirellulaceae bacterium]|nr:hypothetical protein [Pirellulaceae bacterium]